jgi:hypothetical protein
MPTPTTMNQTPSLPDRNSSSTVNYAQPPPYSNNSMLTPTVEECS